MGLPQPHRKKLPYPKSVFFIVSNEFCERFSYYGMRTILSLYLVDILLFNESDATVIFHVFVMFVYFFPIFGAMLADSVLGKFRTIFYVSIIYAIGNIVLALGAVTNIDMPQIGISMLGLILVAIGTGGIKPCVAAFGGDQFVLPQQELQLATFFSMFYFSINAGSLISTAITPILRENVHCFGEESCFSLAFGVPGILMIVSIIVFVAGKSLYRIREPEGNMVIKVSKCIGHAIKTKSKNKHIKKEHWLDHAEEKYGKKLVDDIKATLKVLVLYIPLPIFWTLFDQQSTGWTFQARRMDGDIGFYTILPDQLQVINPLLILAFIPLFQYCIYPILNKLNLVKRPLQRLVCGGLLAAVAFAISAAISLALEAGYPELPTAGNGQIRIYNNAPCDITINSAGLNENKPINIEKLDFYTERGITIDKNHTALDFNLVSSCLNTQGTFDLYEEKAIGYFVNKSGMQFFLDDVEKHEKGLPKVRILINLKDPQAELVNVSLSGESVIETNSTDASTHNINPGTYTLKIKDFEHKDMKFYLGGVYAILVTQKDDSNYDVLTRTVTEPNNIHMLWLLPQYVVITMGEIMFSITGLEFSYSQAPTSMKSVLQACWLLTTAIGNLIVVIIQSLKIFDKQSHNFFLYAGLMVADMAIFALMAMRYKYVVKEESSSDEMNMPDVKQSDSGLDNPVFKKADDN